MSNSTNDNNNNNNHDADSIDPQAFRQALGAFATGVTIVTTRDANGVDVGLTANSFNSVSLQPPMVLWSLDKQALSLKAFTEAEYFAVHILADNQQPLSDRFAKKGSDKFAGLALTRGKGGIPLLDDCAARFECKTAFKYEGGDHEIFVGEVVEFVNFNKPPLAFLGGKYAVAVPRVAASTGVEDKRELDASFTRGSLSYLVSNAHYLFDRQLRDIMQQHSLSRGQFYTMSQLGNESPLQLKLIRANLDFAGLKLSAAETRELVAKNLVQEVPDAPAPSLALTETGRKMMIETSAVIKAMDEDAQAGIGYSEMQLLHQLLRKLVQNLMSDSSS